MPTFAESSAPVDRCLARPLAGSPDSGIFGLLAERKQFRAGNGEVIEHQRQLVRRQLFRALTELGSVHRTDPDIR